MLDLGKPIRRKVVIKSADPSLPKAEWKLSFEPAGLRFTRGGERKGPVYFLSWRAVLGIGLVHDKRAKGEA